MADQYSGTDFLNKQQIVEATGQSLYMVNKAIEEIQAGDPSFKPQILPRRGIERLFSPDQIRRIQQQIETIIARKL